MNYFKHALLTLAMAALLPLGLAQAAPVNGANVAVIPVCGQAINMGDGDYVYNKALEDAKKRAALKAIARFTSPDGNPESAFQKAAQHYNTFVVGKPTIMKKQTAQGKLLLFAQVNVDFNAIKNYLTQLRELEQDKRLDDEVYFLVRVTGLEQASPALQQKLPSHAIRVFDKCFRDQGLNTVSLDLLQGVMEQYDGISTPEAFIQRVEADVSRNVEISMAVIGEIAITSTEVDANGKLATASCKLKLVRNSNDLGNGPEVLGTFEDTYTIKRPPEASIEEAQQLVVQKAAYNASKYLADLTMQYWQK